MAETSEEKKKKKVGEDVAKGVELLMFDHPDKAEPLAVAHPGDLDPEEAAKLKKTLREAGWTHRGEAPTKQEVKKVVEAVEKTPKSADPKRSNIGAMVTVEDGDGNTKVIPREEAEAAMRENEHPTTLTGKFFKGVADITKGIEKKFQDSPTKVHNQDGSVRELSADEASALAANKNKTEPTLEDTGPAVAAGEVPGTSGVSGQGGGYQPPEVNGFSGTPADIAALGSNKGAMEHAPSDLPPGYMPPDAGAPNAMPPPPGATGPALAGAGLSGGVSGDFKPVEQDPALMQQANEAHQLAVAQGLESTQKLGDIAKQNQANYEELRKNAMQQTADSMEDARLAKQAQLNSINNARTLDSAYQATMARVQEEASRGTDPARYWKNQSVGQKAMAVISSALFGFAGKGMEALQRLDSLVEQDIRVQIADRSSKVQGLEAQAKGYDSARNFALQSGASEAEAHGIMRNARLASMKTYIDMMGQNSQNAQVQMSTAQLSAGLAQKMEQGAQELATLGRANTDSQNRALYESKKLAEESRHNRAAEGIAREKAEKGGTKQLKGKAYDEIRNASEALDTLNEMGNMASGRSFGAQTISGMKSIIPVVGAEEKSKIQAYGLLRSRLQMNRGKSVLRKFDEHMLGKNIPELNDSNASAWVDQMKKMAQKEYDNAVELNRKAGYDMSEFEGGASSGGVPSYAKGE